MLKHGLNQGTLLAACGWIVCYNIVLKIIEKHNKGCTFRNQKRDMTKEAIAPTIVDVATIAINEENVKEKAQEVLHLHQDTFRELGGHCNDAARA